jgi:hypothetical protein
MTLTALGGSVSWSITVSGGKGHVSVQPSAGTLRRAGDRVSVTIQANHVAGGRLLTVSPGGTEFTLVIGGASGQAGARIPAWDRGSPGRVTMPWERIVFLFI